MAEQVKVYACTVCKLRASRPELFAEVLTGLGKHPTPKISAYLNQKHGLNITPNKIRDHFHLNHEERFK
jgi:hypothetical protein